MPTSIEHINDPERLRNLLQELQEEHRDLKTVIDHLEQIHVVDELLLHRLKKRKLLKKDQIAHVERLLASSIPA